MLLASVACFDCFCFFSSRRLYTICSLVTGVQTCALPLSVDHEPPVIARNASDPCIWFRGAAPEISAQTCERRACGLLRADGTGGRLRPGKHDNPCRSGRWRLQAARIEDLDHQ